MGGWEDMEILKKERKKKEIAQRCRIEPKMIGKKRGKKSMKWFLVILCCTHRLMLSPIVIRNASPSNWCRDPQPNIRCTSGNPTEYGEERLWEPERPTLPCKNIKGTTDLGSWEHKETEPPTRDPLWDWSGPSEQVLQLCGFVFLWDSWKREWGLPLTLLPGFCILFLLTSFSLNKRGSM